MDCTIAAANQMDIFGLLRFAFLISQFSGESSLHLPCLSIFFSLTNPIPFQMLPFEDSTFPPHALIKPRGPQSLLKMLYSASSCTTNEMKVICSHRYLHCPFEKKN